MYVAPQLPWEPHTRSLGTYFFDLVSILSASSYLDFSGGSALYSMGVLGHACLACPLRSSERFLSAFRALPGALA